MEDRNTTAKNVEDHQSANMVDSVISAKTAAEVKSVSMENNVNNAKTAVGLQSASMEGLDRPARTAEVHLSANITELNHIAKTAAEVPSASMVELSHIAKNAEDLQSANTANNVHNAQNVVVVVRVKGILSQIVVILEVILEYYDMYCTLCFRNLFPNDPRTALIQSNKKEIMWVNALLQSEIIANYDWVYDKPFYVSFDGGCCNTKRRIDLWCIIGNVLFAIEIDEFQHKDRAENYEETRYNDLAMDFTGRQIFLRINPDSFLVNNVRLDPSFDERLSIAERKIGELLDTIDVEVDSDSFTFVQVHHLFYDE